jgi:hydroxymethylbilane synthase
MTRRRVLRVGTRASRLALWQTDSVIAALSARWPELTIERVSISTIGDRLTDVPLPRIGDKGVFTRELEDGLRDGTIDLAVHSLKDLPTDQPHGLSLAAVLEREDPRDALVATTPLTLETLGPGARIGTSSLRRRAQLLALRPDLDVRDLRGNVPTRVDRVWRGDLDAAVLAAAGLNRLGMTDRVAQILDPRVMLPAPGQGAMAVQVRADDDETHGWLAVLDHPPTRMATAAERSLLAALEGGCQVPIAALATAGADDRMILHGLVASLDGASVFRHTAEARVRADAEAAALGRVVAEALLDAGAGGLLREIRVMLPSPPRGAA